MARIHITNLKGPEGPEGPQGIPGVLAVDNDTAVASYFSNAGPTATKTAVTAYLDGLLSESGLIRGDNGKEYRIIAGALRNTGSPNYWQPIDDGAHSPIGIASVTTDANFVTVNFIESASVVAYGDAVVDETMSGLRYTSGISLGTGSISISLTREAIVDYISWNGTAFTSASGQMTPAAMETSGRVICSHGPIEGFGASVHSGNSANQAVMWTLSGNSTSIAWRNAAGALITTPTAACNAYVTRIGSGRIDPRLAGTESANANLWFYAILEVTP